MKIEKPIKYIVDLDNKDNKILAECYELMSSIYREMNYLKLDILAVYWSDNQPCTALNLEDIEDIIRLLEVGLSSKYIELHKKEV